MNDSYEQSDRLLKSIIRELDGLEAAYRTRNPLFTGVLLSLPGLSVLVPMAVRSGASLSSAAWVVIGMAWITCCALVGWWQRRRLEAQLDSVREQIVDSGIIERLAIAPESLPDIHSYTALPWQLFLGPPPTSLAHWLKLIAANLTWYLREPRLWFRPVWVANATVILPYILAVAIISYRHKLSPLFGYATSASAIDPAWYAAIILMLVSVGMALAIGYAYAHQGLVARALRLEIETRLTN